MIAAVLFAWPNRYASDGMMYIRLGRGALTADPTAQNSSVSLQESRSTEVTSIAEMINSYEIAARTADEIGPEELNRPRTWVDRAMKSVQSMLPSVTASDDSADEEYEQQIAREEAIATVQDAIEVVVPKDSYTISVIATRHRSKLAQQIVQTVMDQYKSYHVEAHRSTGSLEFFEEQIAAAQNEALEAQKQLQQTKTELGWMSAESAETKIRERMIKLEIALDQSEGQLAESLAHTEELKKRLREVKEWIPTEITTGIANAASDTMRSQLYDLEVEESESLAKLTPNHPRYRMLQEKMSQSKGIVSKEQEKATDRKLAKQSIQSASNSKANTRSLSHAPLDTKADAIHSQKA